jgi:hypothetical protein
MPALSQCANRLIPARKKADSEGLRRFESDEVNSSFAEHVMPSPMIERLRSLSSFCCFFGLRIDGSIGELTSAPMEPSLD